MRGESVADGIKRRMAEKADAHRKRVRAAVDIAIWSAAVGATVMTMAIAASVLTGAPFSGAH